MSIIKLEEILLEDNSTIRDAVERLEKARCKVVYIVHNNKLKGAVSDGDIRRFVLKNKKMDDTVMEIANTSPTCFYESQQGKIKQFFDGCEAYSAPIVNFNDEITAVVFRNGRVVRRRNLASCPVVIMAGGKGTRLHPYTKILPKALIPVGEIPITERIINSFENSGCNEFFMVVNHQKNMIKSYYEGCQKEYNLSFVEEKLPLGTGGGLYLVKNQIKEDFFFTNCDILIDADYSSMYQAHKKWENAITIVAARYTNKVPYGVIDIDENNQYQEMREKPCMEYLINTGLYLVNHKVLDLIKREENITFPEVIDRAKEHGMKVGVYTVAETAYMDMGQLEELDDMQRKLSLQ